MHRPLTRYWIFACATALTLPLVAGCSSDDKPRSNLTATGGKASGGSSNQAGSSTVEPKGGDGGNDSTGTGGAKPQTGGGGQGGSGKPNPPSMRPEDVCKSDDGCPPGVWVDVSPKGVSLTEGECGNFGSKTIQVDPNRPQDVYTMIFCNGVFKSTDYGQTFEGPINTGMNAAAITDCAGGISLGPTDPDSEPVLYASCIRGSGLGFWVSTNGGVDWTSYNVAPAKGGSDQQFYPPVVDPYDRNHLLMAGHAVDLMVESTDGGHNWTEVKTLPAMAQNGGTSGIAFIDTGDAATTGKTWLWLAAMTGGNIGTWRTTDGGQNWTHVDKNEHVTGATQVWQPDTSGVIFSAGVYSDLGWGVLRSEDYGVTWAHVGNNMQETLVIGTSRFLYAMYGWAIGGGAPVDPTLQVGAQPGTGTWEKPGTPAAMVQGPAQAATTNNGKNNIVLTASYQSGVWRYIEPAE